VLNTHQASQLGEAGEVVRSALVVAMHREATGGHPEFPTGQLAFHGAPGARAWETRITLLRTVLRTVVRIFRKAENFTISLPFLYQNSVFWPVNLRVNRATPGPGHDIRQREFRSQGW
jgi:hypothetical protein